MNRKELVLATLASAEGRLFTPVQIQKAVFLLSRNLPDLVNEGHGYAFEPYDYGPFDASVYYDANALNSEGDAIIANSSTGRWKTYAASEKGVVRGQAILASLPAGKREYIKRVSDWVRSLDFSTLVKSIYEAYPEMRANSIFKD